MSCLKCPYMTPLPSEQQNCHQPEAGADPGFWSGEPSGVLTPGEPEPKILSKFRPARSETLFPCNATWGKGKCFC